MHRLGRYGGVGPIGSSTGKVDVAGRSWELFVGNNGQMKVFSFVAPSPLTTFTADAKLFFTYLQSRQNFPIKTQNLLGMSTPISPRLQNDWSARIIINSETRGLNS